MTDGTPSPQVSEGCGSRVLQRCVTSHTLDCGSTPYFCHDLLKRWRKGLGETWGTRA